MVKTRLSIAQRDEGICTLIKPKAKFDVNWQVSR